MFNPNGLMFRNTMWIIGEAKHTAECRELVGNRQATTVNYSLLLLWGMRLQGVAESIATVGTVCLWYYRWPPLTNRGGDSELFQFDTISSLFDVRLIDLMSSWLKQNKTRARMGVSLSGQNVSDWWGVALRNMRIYPTSFESHFIFSNIHVIVDRVERSIILNVCFWVRYIELLNPFRVALPFWVICPQNRSAVVKGASENM